MSMNTLSTPLKTWPARQPLAFLILAAIIWLVLYQALNPLAEAIVAALPVDRASHLGGALQFFFYDTPKVLLLLTGIVFIMGKLHVTSFVGWWICDAPSADDLVKWEWRCLS